MEKWFVPAGIALLLVAGIAFWVRDPAPQAAPATTDSALLAALADEIANLQEQQQWLRERLSQLEAIPATPQIVATELEVEPLEDSEEAEEAAPPAARPRSEQRIASAGLSPEEFAVIDERAQALYRENFEQEWLARRERFLASEPEPDARQVLRQELGDDAYDRYLYASGQSNRVRVRRVMPGTAAERAGVLEGDILLSYGTERLFGFDDLRRASYQGSPGESVIVEVRRADGSRAQLSVPRGPLGISSSGGWREVPGG